MVKPKRKQYSRHANEVSGKTNCIMGRCGSGKLMWLIFLLSPDPYSSSTYERFYDDINYITTKLLLNSVGDSASEASKAVAAAFPPSPDHRSILPRFFPFFPG